jgi:hypothetical protein
MGQGLLLTIRRREKMGDDLAVELDVLVLLGVLAGLG